MTIETEHVGRREPISALQAVCEAAKAERDYIHSTVGGAAARVKIGSGWYCLTCVPDDPPKQYCSVCGQEIKESDEEGEK